MHCKDEVIPMFRGNDLCPHHYNCTELTGREDYKSLVLGVGPSIVAIISCTFSMLGSLLIVYTYVRWRDIRTGSRSIITFLAIADFVTAFGYVTGSINYILQYLEEPEQLQTCPVFQQVCQIQSFITTTSSLSSFAWTSTLAVYLYLIIVKSKMNLAYRLMPLYHVIAWLGPLLITLPLLAIGNLGYSPYAASNWCYIGESLPYTNPKYQCGHLNLRMVLLIFIAGKAWEIITYIVVILFYARIKWHIYRETKEAGVYNFINPSTISVMQRADKKLSFIPVVFILLRLWGTVQLFYAIGRTHNIYYGCTVYADWIGFQFFSYTQALGDGGQGWGNVVLYVIYSPKIRSRLWYCLRHPSLQCFRTSQQLWPDRGMEERTVRRTVNATVQPKQIGNDPAVNVTDSTSNSNNFSLSTGSGLLRYSAGSNPKSQAFESTTECITA